MMIRYKGQLFKRVDNEIDARKTFINKQIDKQKEEAFKLGIQAVAAFEKAIAMTKDDSFKHEVKELENLIRS